MDHPKLEEWKTVRRERRSVTMVYILLRISVVLVMLAQIFNGNFENVFLCVLTLILFMMPSVLEKKLDITLDVYKRQALMAESMAALNAAR